LGIWLSYWPQKNTPEGAFATEMLVRALKVLNYFFTKIIGTSIDTAALDQPGDEVALMAEPREIGNVEPWNCNIRRIG
jgi:hypothetical protein